MTEHNKDILESIQKLKWELKMERSLSSNVDMEKLLRLSNLYSFLNIEDLLTEAKDESNI